MSAPSFVVRDIAARPDEVWAVLADGWLYPCWVVGAARMRAVDDGWPGEGTKLHHSVGQWPALLDDTTSAVASEPCRRLVLRARAWPAGEASVEVTVEPAAGGCRVTITEDAVTGPGTLVPPPVRRAGIHARNTESLRRLAYLAEGRARPSS